MRYMFRGSAISKEQSQSNLSSPVEHTEEHALETQNKKHSAVQLSPRAARIYSDLQKAIAARKI